MLSNYIANATNKNKFTTILSDLKLLHYNLIKFHNHQLNKFIAQKKKKNFFQNCGLFTYRLNKH